ncbi:MAG: PorT family protein, partial [Bacteroidales bacterium]|nr:PorT family protein [Bacteroidales bacterium]
MKKLCLLIAAFVTFVSVSNAQIVRSESRRTVSQEKTPSESMWYARFGLNFMSAGGDDVADNVKSNLGYQLVWGFEKPMGPLFWGMEFGLGSRGWKVGDIKLTAHNGVFSPFNIGYKHELSSDFAIEAHLGVYVAGDYYGKGKNWPVYSGRYSTEYEDVSIYDIEDYVFPDAGMQFGFGLWYNTIG